MTYDYRPQMNSGRTQPTGQLSPGRELDALVAERVLQLPPVYGPTGVKWDGPVRPYSTDIAAAWEVVERVRTMIPEDEFRVTTFGKAGGWQCTFKYFEAESARAATAPHAICLAALKAVGG